MAILIIKEDHSSGDDEVDPFDPSQKKKKKKKKKGIFGLLGKKSEINEADV